MTDTIEPCAYCGEQPVMHKKRVTNGWEKVFPFTHLIRCETPSCAGQTTHWTFQEGRCIENWNHNVQQKHRVIQKAVGTPTAIFRMVNAS